MLTTINAFLAVILASNVMMIKHVLSVIKIIFCKIINANLAKQTISKTVAYKIQLKVAVSAKNHIIKIIKIYAKNVFQTVKTVQMASVNAAHYKTVKSATVIINASSVFKDIL
ncbi:hypothetical protein ABPG74_020939 [Tetrahymena malaccensis]